MARRNGYARNFVDASGGGSASGASAGGGDSGSVVSSNVCNTEPPPHLLSVRRYHRDRDDAVDTR